MAAIDDFIAGYLGSYTPEPADQPASRAITHAAIEYLKDLQDPDRARWQSIRLSGLVVKETWEIEISKFVDFVVEQHPPVVSAFLKRVKVPRLVLIDWFPLFAYLGWQLANIEEKNVRLSTSPLFQALSIKQSEIIYDMQELYRRAVVVSFRRGRFKVDAPTPAIEVRAGLMHTLRAVFPPMPSLSDEFKRAIWNEIQGRQSEFSGVLHKLELSI